MKEEVAILKKRLNQNSSNSHISPSKDKIKIKAAKQRKRGGKVGGKENHKGHTLEKVLEVDEIVPVVPSICECGCDLKDCKSQLIDTRQEFDIPVLNHIVTEYQLRQVKCPGCKRIIKGEYPIHIKAPTQYGPNIKAFSVITNTEYKVPYAKVSEMINCLFGLNISEGSLVNFTKKCSIYLENAEAEIVQSLAKTKVAHTDETGVIVNLVLMWMHVMSNDQFTYLRVHDKRGSASFDELLKNYNGNLIHDFFKSYFGLSNSKHNPCGSHISRELESLIEDQSKWADKFKRMYYELYHENLKINNQNKSEIYRRFNRIITEGKLEEPLPIRTGKRGQEKKSKGLNLLLRLEKYKDEVLEFAFNPLIPFTNNQAERDLRHTKIKLKVSGCFRSLSGAKEYARIMSVFSTMKKQAYNVFDCLVQSFKEQNFSFST